MFKLANSLCRSRVKFASVAFSLLGLFTVASADAAISQSPLIIRQPEPPLIMLTVERDEKLYNVAYNDYSDIDGDGSFDVGYKPGVITYYGLFDSQKCYSYDTANQYFTPVSAVVNAQFKTCGQSVAWSGDYLNYLTTSRIDALRKVFYGGRRVVDTATSTVLERQFIPQDNHSWGKEFNTVRSGYEAALPATTKYTYKVSDYTPFGEPSDNARQHLFVNLTRNNTALPLLRVLLNRQERVWNWVAKEGPQGDNVLDPNVDSGAAVGGGAVTPTDYVVRVAVCVQSVAFPLEENCKGYPALNPTVWKPTGILHSYGENRSVAFGLITGSYEKPRSGGVLRKNIGFFDDEVNQTTGVFDTNVNGIVGTLDKLRIAQWTAGGYVCAGGCKDYGNPVAEMMYEGLRYFSGATAPTSAFDYTGGVDAGLSLPKPAWLDPFRPRASGGFATCSKPFQMVISDVGPTFDSDELPGGSFGSITASPARLAGLDVSALGSTIWNEENLGSKRYFIGESLANTGNTYDQAPTAKLADSFGTIRGIAPTEPTRQGSYYAASVARFGANNPIAGATGSTQPVATYAIALAPPVPTLKIPVGDGQISIAPFGKSVGGCNYGEFVAGTTFLTNRVAGFFFGNVYNIKGFPDNPNPGLPSATNPNGGNGGLPFGQFRVSFEDNEQGTDNDMDAIVVYDFRVNADKTLTIELSSTYAAGCINQSIGFVIAGSTQDGAYLGVRDVDGAGNAYVLNDTTGTYNPNPMPPNTGSAVIGTGTLGIRYSRTFNPSTGPVTSGAIPQDPLWYAAKYGVIGGAWDANNDGVPDNYALVTNPAKLLDQITAALDRILTSTLEAKAVSASSGLIQDGTTVAYTTSFTSGRTSIPRTTGNAITANVWEGRLDAIRLNTDGSPGATLWSTSNGSFLPANTRPVYVASVNSAGATQAGPLQRLDSAFLAPTNAGANVSGGWVSSLAPGALRTLLQPSLVAQFGTLTAAQLRFRTAEAVKNYLLGDQSLEVGNVAPPSPPGVLRPRNLLLGDIVASTPTVSTKRGLVLVGANDGMLHAFDTNGKEVWAFIPTALRSKLSALALPGYSHQYYVNGDIAVAEVDGGRTIAVAALGAGARSVVALDISSNPPTLLWEKTGAELGYVLGRVKIVKVPTGANTSDWAVVFGNGYESSVPIGGGNTKTVSKLFIVEAKSPSTSVSGADIGGISGSNRLVVPDTVAYNGMGSPALVDGGNVITGTVPTIGTANTITDVWVGDLGGNLWKFDLRGGPGSWGLAYPGTIPRPLFKAERASIATGATIPQPITAEPSVSKSFGVGYYVAFGTGKFFEDSDRNSAEIQSIYLVRDLATRYQRDTAASVRFGLRRSDLTQLSIRTFSGGSRTYREVLPLAPGVTVDTTKGWFIDLLDQGSTSTGERVITRPVIAFPNVFTGTLVPTPDACDEGSGGWLMGVPIEGGNRAGLFDTNNDGAFGTGDQAAVGARLGGGVINNFGLIAQPNGSTLSFYGVPDDARRVAGGAGLRGLARDPKIFAGRTSWRGVR
jgi:type IV pilus assembly protein PilY1